MAQTAGRQETAMIAAKLIAAVLLAVPILIYFVLRTAWLELRDDD